MSCCSDCLFNSFKLIYIFLTCIVLIINISDIHQYLSELHDLESLFNHNHFAHFMRIFLGFLFRISGLLSAIKEKIALTFTYCLFLILLLLVSKKYDLLFMIYLITAIFSLIYVWILKSIRSKKKDQQNPLSSSTSRISTSRQQHQQQQRTSRNNSTSTNTTTISTNNNNDNTRSSLILVNILDDPAGRIVNVLPSAPSFDDDDDIRQQQHQQHLQSSNRSSLSINDNNNNLQPPLYDQHQFIMGGGGGDNSNYPRLNHTPPPSYTELFESKQ